MNRDTMKSVNKASDDNTYLSVSVVAYKEKSRSWTDQGKTRAAPGCIVGMKTIPVGIFMRCCQTTERTVKEETTMLCGPDQPLWRWET